jgi:hypothetical protein
VRRVIVGNVPAMLGASGAKLGAALAGRCSAVRRTLVEEDVRRGLVDSSELGGCADDVAAGVWMPPAGWRRGTAAVLAAGCGRRAPA